MSQSEQDDLFPGMLEALRKIYTQAPSAKVKRIIRSKVPLKYLREPKPRKQKGWATPYGCVDMSRPVTYEEACSVAKSLYDECLAEMRADNVRS